MIIIDTLQGLVTGCLLCFILYKLHKGMSE